MKGKQRKVKFEDSLPKEGSDATVQLPYNWEPREDQLPFWLYLQKGGKRAVCVAHRKWGKDTVGMRWGSVAAIERVGSYWHMLPKYSEARKAIWEPVDPESGLTRIEATFPREAIANIRDTDMFIKFVNGSTWQMVGSDNYNSLVGAPPVGIVFSEYSLCDPKAWAYMRPILAQNGGWAIFLYTPRGENHGYDLVNFAKTQKDWYWQIIRASESPVFSPAMLAKEKEELIGEWGENEGLAFYNQEYECSFGGFTFGAYYAGQMAKLELQARICNVEWEKQLPVYTAWDLGIDDSMSIWIYQVSGNEFRFIDYVEDAGKNFNFYAEELLHKRPYVYAEHFMPHDVRVREMGAGMEGQKARSRKDTLEKLGIKPIQVVERARDGNAVLAGIFTARELLPQCYFDKVKCDRGIRALKTYSASYDPSKKKLSNSPVKDWSSHAADAFRTFAVGWRREVWTPGRNPMDLMDRYYGSLI